MRIKRKTALFAVMVVAMAVAAPAASATPVEVEDPGGDHCTDIVATGDTVSGGCAAHFVSDGVIRFIWHNFGMDVQLLACTQEGTLRIDEAGGLAIDDVTHGCGGVAPCGSANAHVAAPNNGEIPWRSPGDAEETAADTVSQGITFCYVASGIRCEGTATVSIDTGASPYTFTAPKQPLLPLPIFGPYCKIEGAWSVEGDPFTITHL